MMGRWEMIKNWVHNNRITIIRRSLLFIILVLLNSMLFGMFSFGRHPLLRYVLLPNASCRYIDNSPTYCYYYSLQQGLQGGYNTGYVDLVIPVLVLIGLIILFGRAWCAWACPFGLVQEILTWLRERLGIPHIQPGYRWVALMDQIKYGVLVITILLSISLGIPALALGRFSEALSLPFCQICPAKPTFTILQVILGIKPAAPHAYLALAFFLFFIVGSFFIRMFWCRLCPMGAFMALFSKLSLVWLRKDPEKCTKCRICLRVCPQDFQMVYEEMERENITGAECTLCGRCVESCPEEGALSLNILKWTVIRSKPRK